MKKINSLLKSFVNAVAILAYVFFVTWLMADVGSIFGEPAGLVAPVFMLLLFVISAAVTGILVFGMPIFFYLKGLKKEAVYFLCSVLGWLIAFLFIIAVVMLIR